MPRYIDATKLLWIYEHECENYSGLEEMVADVPTADVRENVHGKWVVGVVPQYDRGQGTFCSRCGWAWSDHIDAIKLNPVLSLIKTNFCPNCGADMRKEQK